MKIRDFLIAAISELCSMVLKPGEDSISSVEISTVPATDQLVGFDVGAFFKAGLNSARYFVAEEKLEKAFLCAARVNRCMLDPAALERPVRLLKVNDDKCNIVRLTGL